MKAKIQIFGLSLFVLLLFSSCDKVPGIELLNPVKKHDVNDFETSFKKQPIKNGRNGILTELELRRHKP